MTKTEVANLALSRLGASLIIRLGDDTLPGSKEADLLYEPTLEEVLREFPWSFAEREADLAQLSTAETAHFNYSFQLPADCVRFLTLQTDYRDLPKNEFRRTGSKIHCDASTARVSYITSDLEPDDYDPDFRNAFVTLLASNLATPLLQSPNMAQALKDEYFRVALPKAKTVDGRETDAKENHGIAKSITTSPFVQARYVRRGRYIPRSSS
jgi:hypothetical protein